MNQPKDIPITHDGHAGGRGALLIAGGAILLCALLIFLAHRSGPRLGLDSYYYVEYAKEFRTRMPPAFGSAWPFGWPVVGTLVSFTGIPTYDGMALCAFLALSTTILLSARVAATSPCSTRTVALLIGVGSSLFLWTALVTGVFSEVPFALVLIAVPLVMAHWPAPWALWTAAALAVVAVCLRYVGVFLLPVVVAWTFMERRSSGREQRTAMALVAIAVSGVAVAALFGWNWLATGHLSGSERGATPGVAELPGILSDFGWSVAEAAVSLGASRLLGYGSPGGVAIGLVLLAGPIGLCLWSLRCAKARIERSIALTSISYIACFIALRCIGRFDSHTSRIAAPLVFPMLLLAAWRTPEITKRRILLPLLELACVAIIVTNVALCARGASGAAGGPDVRAAAAALPRELTFADSVGVNEFAKTIAALTPAHVERVGPGDPTALHGYHYLVIAGEPVTREGRTNGVPREWQGTVATLLNDRAYRVLCRTNDFVVLERAGAKLSVRCNRESITPGVYESCAWGHKEPAASSLRMASAVAQRRETLLIRELSCPTAPPVGPRS